MAVVTEPPWVNQTSGVAARNGTTSHTIPFGFTSTSGNELVFVVFGAVTHTVASGWTERLQPVSSGELSVFTRTSAGDTSITVTHNASNYPVCWVAYEFPSGTSWVAGTGTSPTSDTFPQLTGLPGSEVVVFGARGRVADTVGATGASSVVSPPWVEDADVFAADDGTTDGGYLYVTHQINVTATSVTPAAAATYAGSWFTGDRQHVTFALGVAAAGGGGSSVAPDGISVPVALGIPTLTWSGSIAPDGISVPVALGAPIVGAASIDPDGIAVPVTLGAPALAWSGSVAPDGVSVPVALGSPVVASSGLAPDGIAVPVSLGAPALVWSGAVSPDGISVPVALGAPSLTVPGAVVARPSTGTVTRPASGTVTRPDVGVVSRP